MDIAPRINLLSPWLPADGSAMLYAGRGIGKTFVALSVAYAVASGGAVLRWRAHKPARVLYVDGEMPLASLQSRLSGIAAGAGYSPSADDFLRFLPADYFRDGLPAIDCPEGRALIEKHTDGVDLVIFDNISCLSRAVENEAEAWQPVQDLVLSLRRRKTTSLLIHHAGKGGAQRGTSRREDILDTVLTLKRPDNYDPKDGAKFTIEFEKARGFMGADAAGFVATLTTAPDGAMTWEDADPDSDMRSVARGMFAEGSKAVDVMKSLGASKPSAYRWFKEWKDGGND